MTVNEFNSKINLPGVCMALGIKDFKFVKVPKFGWFAYQPGTNIVMNLFQMVPEDWRPTKVYRFLTQENTSYQESKMYYSEVSENKLRSNYLYTGAWNSFYNAAKLEAREGKVYVQGRRVRLTRLLEELGLPKLIDNGVGLVNEAIFDLKEFKILDLNESYKNKLLIPSFATPNHPCSFEIVNPMNLNERTTVFMNREKGWYGKLDHRIATDLAELGAHDANTWDHKCDFWNSKVISLSPNLNIEQCVRIWTEAKLSIFYKSPLDVIIENNGQDQVKHHIRNLNLVQIKELEQKLDVKLADTWKKQQEEEIVLGNTRFIKKNNRYYVERFGVEQEMTNFILKTSKIVCEKGEYFHIGHVYYNDQEVAFKLPDSAFRSHTTLTNELRKFFLDAAIGIPIILPTYKHYLVNVINRFNSDLIVDRSTS